MTVTLLPTGLQAGSVEAARLLRALAEMAEQGEIVGVTVLVESSGGRYQVEFSRTANRLERMGALMEALLSQSAGFRPEDAA